MPPADNRGDMGFDKFKNFWNVDIKDGVEGKAFVQSASHPPDDATATNVMMWLDVYVEGWEPYRVEHNCVVKISKHPQPGETLPVIVDRENKERIDIQWDQVKTVDELMRDGQPGQISGVGNITMGQPQVIDLRNAGLSGDVNERIQQAMQIAQQTLQAQGGAIAPGATPATPAASENMVTKRLAQLEQLASLRDSGVLTDAEFEAEKVKILSSG